jgi:hypothetical protein
LLTFRTNQANLGDVDLTVDSLRFVLSYCLVSLKIKKSAALPAAKRWRPFNDGLPLALRGGT